eukprot:CAMPEP_0202781090 /NCGR_PEP_ID=MMETSP1388-20130828/60007_1 /ASSEMBLY_ACC=CAM_ASM_000864 /TAXON_ID=37098 /ORGANISM="Isochrysis sp, Strain CCMP1244" /LENGTH=68 /DNA_ID=CAMNT_0049450489 /DNA_START=255 /DNA_END=459 /DNA_ORIENTATION=-
MCRRRGPPSTTHPLPAPCLLTRDSVSHHVAAVAPGAALLAAEEVKGDCSHPSQRQAREDGGGAVTAGE